MSRMRADPGLLNMDTMESAVSVRKTGMNPAETSLVSDVAYPIGNGSTLHHRR